ncbi:MAG: glycosyltransferase [Alicyclobacillus sp.]|nr:glycosyltransferase [Alicyclobacillus sp.]
MGKVDVVVLTRNNLKDTRECLSYLYANHSPNSFNLIVIDQCSTDGTRRYLHNFAREHRNVHVELLSENVGFARGCNIGASRGSADKILFLNNDALLGYRAIDRLSMAMDESGADAIGPISNETGEVQRLWFPYDSSNYTREFPAMYEYMWKRYRTATATFHRLAGFCLLVRRASFESVGGFSTHYGVGYYEDDDLCYRLRAKGYKLAIALGIFVHHHGSRSFRKAKLSSSVLMAHNRHVFLENSYFSNTLHGSHDFPLVSVVICTYNRPQQLVQAIRSVLAQTYRQLEIIVVRDGGAPVSHLVEQLNDGRIRLLDFEENRGKSAALNVALQNARGEYIAYLDDDDIYFSRHLEYLVHAAVKTGADFVYSDSEVRVVDKHGRQVNRYYISNEHNIQRMECSNYIPNLAILHRNDRRFRYDEGLISIEDWDFLRKATIEWGCEFVHVPVVTHAFYVRASHTSRNGLRHRNPRRYFEIEAEIRTRTVWWVESIETSETLRYKSWMFTDEDQRIKILGQALKHNPWNVLVQIDLAKLLWKKGQLRDAFDVLSQTVLDAPGTYEHLQTLIPIAVALEEWEQVRRLCELAIYLAPTEDDLAQVYIYLSMAYASVNPETARLCYARSAWLRELRHHHPFALPFWRRSKLRLLRKYRDAGVRGVIAVLLRKFIVRVRRLFELPA